MSTKEERIASARENRLRVVLGAPARWWWLSFADARSPEGQQFLGVAIVPALCMGSATMAAHAARCNPGGEVQGYELPADAVIPPGMTNRLLTRAEAEALNESWAGGIN